MDLLIALLKFSGLMAVAAGIGILIGTATASVPWFKRVSTMKVDSDPNFTYAIAGSADAVPSRKYSRRDDGSDDDTGDGGDGSGGGD